MLRTTILASLLAVAAGPCAADDVTDSAVFSYFEYRGNDDFYRINPLIGSGEFYNPVLSGWNSDPSICRRGNDYFMVTSSFCYYPGVPIYHSKNLVNWRLIGNVLNRPSQLAYLPGQDFGTGGIYASTIRYNPKNKLFYMITTDVGALPYANEHGAGGMDKGSHFYVTTADPFSNKWSEPVWLPDIGGIDPDLFFDDDGSAYIIHKEDTKGKPKWSNNRALRIIRFDPATGKTFGNDMPFAEYGVGPEEQLPRDEGPHIYKIDGRYYLVCAEGGTGLNHSAVVYRADSVTGPYERWSRNPMITQRNLSSNRTNAVTCSGHADLVQTPDGEWWAVFLACRPGPGNAGQLGRETFMLPVRWSKDGFPYLLFDQESVPLRLKHKGIKYIQGTTTGNFTWCDDFNGKTLKPEWISMWGPAEAFYSIKDGALRLTPSAELPAGKKPLAYLGRRMQHHRYSAETEITFTPKAGEVAGIMVMRNEKRHYVFGISQSENGKTEAVLLKPGNDGYKEMKATTLKIAPGEPVKLKAECEGDTYRFLYKTPSDSWKTLKSSVPASFTGQSAGGFIGSTIGICALKTKQQTAKTAQSGSH